MLGFLDFNEFLEALKQVQSERKSFASVQYWNWVQLLSEFHRKLAKWNYCLEKQWKVQTHIRKPKIQEACH